MNKFFANIVWAAACGLALAPGYLGAAELDDWLAKINPEVSKHAEARVRNKLNGEAAKQFFGVLPAGRYGHNGTKDHYYVKVLPDGTWHLAMKYGIQANLAAEYLMAYEVLGDKNFLEVGLKNCDFLLRAQQPRGHWLRFYNVSTNGVITTTLPGREPPPESHDLEVRFQDGYQDQHIFVLLYAWRLTHEQKYFDAAKRCADCLLELENDNGTWPDYCDLGKAATNGPITGQLGVRVGCSYNDGATTRPLGVMLAMYHVTKDPKYLAKLRRIGPWIFATQLGQGKVRGWCQQYRLDNQPLEARGFEMPLIEPMTFTRFVFPLAVWFYQFTGEERYINVVRETYDWLKSVEHPEGWAYEYLADGTEVFSTNYKTYRYDQPSTWPDGKNPYPLSRTKVQLQGIPPILQLHQAGGREALRRHFSGPVSFTPEQYLAARIAAAQAAAKLTAVPKDLPSRKAEHALYFQHLVNVRLAQGAITAESAAPGGYGVLSAEPGWHWLNRVCKVADWFEVPGLN